MAKYKKSSARYNRKVERSTKHALPIPIPTEPLREFCRRNHIRRLAVFGSALRNDFRPDSDIDLLVEFEPEHTPSLLQMARLERELSAFFGGRKIDLRTKEDLSRYFRDAVVASAKVIYHAR
jgi:predicted nucleotidyltransferase